MTEDELDIIGAEADEESTGEGQEWLTTFADLSMLMMVFFVLLFSMSTLDTEKFSDMFVSVSRALQGKESKLATSKISREEAGSILDQLVMKKQIMEAQKKVFSDMQFFQTQNGLEGVIGANFEDGVITLQAPAEVLFPSGEVELLPKGRVVIKQLKEFFIQHPDQIINIRGFTDDVPPTRGSRFKDNWEISALRAVNVLRYLVQLGVDPDRMTATGLADLEPLYPNISPANRAKNRRVEFVLERRVTGEP